MSQTGKEQHDNQAPATIDAASERRNGFLFGAAVLMTYFAAPVTYVGIVQAALCNKLGANATVSNLPASLYVFGGLAPLFVASRVPLRLEKKTAAMTMVLTAIGSLLVAGVLLAPVSGTCKIAIVISESCLVGFLALVQQTYLFQCLKRGTTLTGRARALKLTYTIGPAGAVVGSLLAQYLLNTATSANDTSNFALLYIIAVPCNLIGAVAASRMRLVDARAVPLVPIGQYLQKSLRSLRSFRALWLICLILVIHSIGTSILPNLLLHVKSVIGDAPEQVAGYVMALQFGAKSISGYMYGSLTERKGTQATLVAIEITLLAGVSFGCIVRGPAYLFVFALMGAAQLAGVYYPNYCLSISKPETGARNLSLMMLTYSLAGTGPALHGMLDDMFGMPASFLLAAVCGVASLFLVLKLPAENMVVEPEDI